MKARCLGDAVRANTSPLLFFLAPSLHPLALGHQTSRLAILSNTHAPPQQLQTRTFTALSDHQAANATAAARQEESEEPEEPRAQGQPQPRSNNRQRYARNSGKGEMNNLVKNLVGDRASPPSPPSADPPRHGWQHDSRSATAAQRRTDLRSESPTRRRQAHLYPDPFAASSSRTEFSNMQFPNKDPDGAPNSFDARNLGLGISHSLSTETAPVPKAFRLDAFVGRGVNLNASQGIGLGAAIRRMEFKMARNKVRRESMQQRFHERDGLKRKRLKSERWRRRFKEGFQEVCRKVERMRKQGW